MEILHDWKLGPKIFLHSLPLISSTNKTLTDGKIYTVYFDRNMNIYSVHNRKNIYITLNTFDVNNDNLDGPGFESGWTLLPVIRKSRLKKD